MKIPLTGGAYEAHSLAAAAQRQVNLYSEPIPQGTGEPAPVALFPTPGLRTLATVPQAPVRGIHSATNGALYVVAGAGVYAVSTAWAPTLLGSITGGRTNPVSMSDNGLELVIVDGSGSGWKVTLAGNTFAPIVDPTGSFRGGGRVGYLDTFFLFSVPGTPQFQVSDSLALTFDPLYFANKEAFSDLLVTLIVAKREIWLLGTKTTEIWYNKGGGDFPFESMPGVFISRGCAAPYSAAGTDNAVYWLSQDRDGAGIVLQGAGYQATRISTYPIEAEMATYPTITDAIGYTYQMAGHVFYVLNFPAADKSWSYDVTTKLWHELVWLDTNGAEHRHRANCAAAGYGIVVCGDHSSGKLYALDPAVFTDAGVPIKRLRSFPHIVADGKRQVFRQFIADMDTGNVADTTVAVPAPPAASGFVALSIGSNQDGGALGVSADGTITAGFVTPPGGLAQACYWVGTDGPPILIPGVGPNSGAYGATTPGPVIWGNTSSQPFRWSAAGGLVLFGAPGDTMGGVAPSGAIVVGSTGNEQACYWNSSLVKTTLGFLPGHNNSRAIGVSADGTYIVGQSKLVPDPSYAMRAFRWTAAGGMVDLGVTGGAFASRGFGVSDDGSLVGGDLDTGGNEAFQWTPTGGMTVPPMLDPAANSTITCVSGDGTTLVGYAGLPYPGLGGKFAAYWTAAGITIPTPVELDPTDPGTVQETYPTGVSADGKTIVGYTFGSLLPWLYHVTASPASTPAVVDVTLISLRWSDDRGHSFGSPVGISLGAVGEYLTSLQWQRLGLGRSRVFQISWSSPVKTTLLGAWVDHTPAQT